MSSLRIPRRSLPTPGRTEKDFPSTSQLSLRPAACFSHHAMTSLRNSPMGTDRASTAHRPKLLKNSESFAMSALNLGSYL